MKSTLILAISLTALAASAQSDTGICKLLPDSVIAKTQGSRPVTTRPSSSDNGKLQSAQCFYELAPFARSVSLQVISRSAKAPLNLRDFWQSRFHGKDLVEKDTDGHQREESSERRAESEEQERHKPPVAVKGVGEEAFWVDTGRDGALYAFAGEHIVRVSIGGNLPREKKVANASTLARSVVEHLSLPVAAGGRK